MPNNMKWWEDPVLQPFFKSANTPSMKTEYTVSGADGKIQPNKPIDAIQTNQGLRMIHEGELKVSSPDGRFAVVPAKQIGQPALQQLEQQAKVPGFAQGVNAGITGILNGIGTLNAPANATVNAAKTASKPAPVISQNTPTDYHTLNIPTLTPAPENQGITYPTTNVTTAGGTQPKPAPVAPTPGVADQTLGTDIIRNYATGQGPYIQAITNNMMQRQGAAATAATAALKQQEAMGGMSAEQIASAQNIRQRDVGEQQSALEAQLAQTAESTQLGAAGQLQQIGTQANETDYQRTTAAEALNYNRQMTLATTQLNSGDYADAASTLNKLYPGSKIDFSSLVTDKNAAKVASAVSAIANYSSMPGMTADNAYAIMQKTGQLDGSNLSESDFRTMFAANQIQSDPIASIFANISDNSISSIIGETGGLIANTPENKAEIKRELGMLALTGGFSAQTGIDASKLNAAKYPMLYLAFGETASGEAAGYTFAGRTGDTFTFKDAASGKTITKNLTQVENSTDFATLAGVTPKTFTPDAGMTFTGGASGNTLGKFNESGLVWTAEGQTQSLSAGQNITLGSNFTVQNGSNVIPAGNYITNEDKTIGEKTVKTITAVGGANDGQVYVINDVFMNGSGPFSYKYDMQPDGSLKSTLLANGKIMGYRILMPDGSIDVQDSTGKYTETIRAGGGIRGRNDR